VLWTATFTRYFVARSVSVFGDAMLTVAAALAIGQIYGATGAGVVLAAWTVPFLGCILFGGVFADRLRARPLMLGADPVPMVAQLLVAVSFFVGTPEPALRSTRRRSRSAPSAGPAVRCRPSPLRNLRRVD
jgi:MFS family permease